jgi:CGNR zinc finger
LLEVNAIGRALDTLRRAVNAPTSGAAIIPSAKTRRWCSMEGCGSRVKMRRYYARSKQAGKPVARRERPPSTSVGGS